MTILHFEEPVLIPRLQKDFSRQFPIPLCLIIMLIIGGMSSPLLIMWGRRVESGNGERCKQGNGDKLPTGSWCSELMSFLVPKQKDKDTANFLLCAGSRLGKKNLFIYRNINLFIFTNIVRGDGWLGEGWVAKFQVGWGGLRWLHARLLRQRSEFEFIHPSKIT